MNSTSKPEITFSGIGENMKWDANTKSLSTKLSKFSQGCDKHMSYGSNYCACLLRYGLIFVG
jgi:hypothetical protein